MKIFNFIIATIMTIGGSFFMGQSIIATDPMIENIYYIKAIVTFLFAAIIIYKE